jgi:protein-tyrosine phosphatase
MKWQVGRVVRFLLSSEASYITATGSAVDGGNISSSADRGNEMQRINLVFALALTPLVQGCATTQTYSVTAPIQGQFIPFEAASVSRREGTDDHVMSWSAPGARKVTIFAGSSPDKIDRTRPVAAGGGKGSTSVSGLARDRRWFFELVPDRGAPLIIADRSVNLATAPNLRDVGGYRTVDGRWVAMGLVYRSDQLDRLTDRDFAKLSSLGLRTVADLRTESERRAGPDRVPTGAEHLILDVAADSKDSLGGDMRAGLAAIQSGRGAEMLTAANREFVSLDSARHAYQQLLRRIAATDGGATLYHCTAGKDRTGWATAVLLTLLGVPRETVMADYLASNAYLADKNQATLVALANSARPISPAHLEPVLTVRAAYIDAAFAEVERRHRTMEAYVRDGLGIDDATVARLREAMLTGAPRQ